MGIPFCFGCMYYWDNHETAEAYMKKSKRYSILLPGLALLLTGLAAGCVSQQPREYIDPSQGIEIGLGE